MCTYIYKDLRLTTPKQFEFFYSKISFNLQQNLTFFLNSSVNDFIIWITILFLFQINTHSLLQTLTQTHTHTLSLSLSTNLIIMPVEIIT